MPAVFEDFQIIILWRKNIKLDFSSHGIANAILENKPKHCLTVLCSWAVALGIA